MADFKFLLNMHQIIGFYKKESVYKICVVVRKERDCMHALDRSFSLWKVS